MSGNNSVTESGQEKTLSETSIQTVPQNLTTIQSIQTVQTIQSAQNAMSSGIQNIQTAQTVSGPTGTLVGKSISLELNSKLLMKPSIPSNINTSENNKITTSTFCPVGSTVRIIAPSMLSTIDRQAQSQVQQTAQQSQQIVTSIPSTYHVPRGPAAVANISTPRATVATPLVRAISTGQPIPISRPGVNTTVSNTQWQPKNASVVYAQPQRHPVPVVNRTPTRPIATAVYTSQQQQQPQLQPQQQPRLVSPGQIGVGRPVQATVVTATPSRLIAPVLQAQNNSIAARLPAPTRPPTPQVVGNLPQVAQPGRSIGQAIQPIQTSRPLNSTPINRIAVSAPVIGGQNRVATVTSVQTVTAGRQLTINTAAGGSTGTVSRIVIPQQALQQQQQQQQQQGAPRIVQTVTPLANFGQVSRVIATTSTNVGVATNVARVAQTGPTSVARITGMSLHPLPLTPSRATPTPLKVTAQSGLQTVQLKQTTAAIQPQVQSQQQQQQQQGQTLQRTISNVNNANAVVTSTANQPPSQVQGQYMHPPHTATYYSIETSGTYSPYRQTNVQPVRLLVEQGFEEPLGKPNASPRPSILRKRDHDCSPGKAGVVKNLVPVLASLPTVSSASSPPGSPKCDRDGGGNQSSGSTTVSATSSPGLDEEPEQSRITINPTVEMSPRKKPRKQQLTGVELTEPKCSEEDMQFITEEKIKKEIKEEQKEKFGERKSNSNLQQDHKPLQTTPVKARPTPSLLGTSWKNRWGGRLHHYRRPSDVRPREERRPTVNEIAQQKHVLQKVNGWKVYHLTSQMEDLAELEKSVHEKLKATLTMLESQQIKGRQDDSLERANELVKGNMQRSSLISEGMNEARVQLTTIFQHKTYVTDLLQRCGNKRAQKKRDK